MVVFVGAHSLLPWYPNRVARQLPSDLPFDAVWVVSLAGVETEQYVYQVALLDLTDGNAPYWRVTLGKAFDRWTVEIIQ